jgi:predicted phage baseplate assembly protein
MPLPTPNLDDLAFQAIVDAVKQQIHIYCPEWTDHNVSDPGVTLIELFASMCEMLIYRVNQVPDRMYVKFLELIGVQLLPTRAAVAPVTFYLAKAQEEPIPVPANTQVATIRTETAPAIVFSTETDLTIHPARSILSVCSMARRGATVDWTSHSIDLLGRDGRRIMIFPTAPNPMPGDALCLELERDYSHHVLALVLACDRARGAGVNPASPPLKWQVSQGDDWADCVTELDSTGGFSEASGEIVVRLPAMGLGTCNERKGYWLRCVLQPPSRETGAYQVSPEIEGLRIEARGATVHARHAILVTNEMLGVSDGLAGQTFKLRHRPILELDSQTEQLIVSGPTGEQPWEYVPDFAGSYAGDDREDYHYTLDFLDGTLSLGPALRQPDGSVYRFGATPGKGSTLMFSRYRYGGGAVGNLPAGALTVLKHSDARVARVCNWARAEGGRDAQSVEDAKLRAPAFLRTRSPLVTLENYEQAACEIQGVARARCIGPGEQPGSVGAVRPGQLVIVVLPKIEDRAGRIDPADLAFPIYLYEEVQAKLAARGLAGITIDVRQPQYRWVSVKAHLRAATELSAARQAAVQRQVEAALYRYLNPYIGGPQSAGWPFGRDLHQSEVASVIQRLPGIDYVEHVELRADDLGGASRLLLQPAELICSDRHTVEWL